MADVQPTSSKWEVIHWGLATNKLPEKKDFSELN